jgi:hypothetical protein
MEAMNLLGQTFGQLTVVERAGSRNGFALWWCRCSCGKECEKKSIALLGKTKSCGCLRLKAISEKVKAKLLGRRFGRLLVTTEQPSLPSRHGAKAQWLCRCDCGIEKVVPADHLTRGVTQSCGCLGRERRIERNTKHGQATRKNKTPEWVMWQAAKRRAKTHNAPFTISLNDIHIPESCPIFGIPLEAGKVNFQDNSPSLDRKNPKLGYVPFNIWVISWKANRIKSNATLEELKTIVAALEKQ